MNFLKAEWRKLAIINYEINPSVLLTLSAGRNGAGLLSGKMLRKLGRIYVFEH